MRQSRFGLHFILAQTRPTAKCRLAQTLGLTIPCSPAFYRNQYDPNHSSCARTRSFSQLWLCQHRCNTNGPRFLLNWQEGRHTRSRRITHQQSRGIPRSQRLLQGERFGGKDTPSNHNAGASRTARVNRTSVQMCGYWRVRATFGSRARSNHRKPHSLNFTAFQKCMLNTSGSINKVRPNPPINRNCNSPLRGPSQSGYWQR